VKKLLLLFYAMAGPAAAQIFFHDQTALHQYNAPSYQITTLADYDRDGDLDFFQANVFGPAFLFLNNREHGLANVIEGSGLDPHAPTATGCWADFNNDGWTDLLVIGYTARNRLYRNNGNAGFTEIAGSLPPEPEDKLTYTAALADYDRDGLVDIFVVNFTEGNKDQLLHNNGDLTFSDVTVQAGFSAFGNGKSRCAAWCDYDQDGDEDVFVGGQRQSALFVNQGNGIFQPSKLDIYDTRAAVWADHDQDGDFDLTVCSSGSNNPMILVNDGQGNLASGIPLPGFAGVSPSYTPLWEDWDNDADLDLALFGNSETGTGLRLLQNLGHDQYRDVTASAGFNAVHNGFSINAADLNNDGRVDLLLHDYQQVKSYFYVNQSAANHWIQLQLTGKQSNYSAIGGVVHLFFAGRHQVLRMEVNGPTSNSPVLEFGLGSLTWLDSLAIYWPSGRVQRRYRIAADQRLQITESDTVSGRDVAIERVVNPLPLVSSGEIIPAVVLKNYGRATAQDLWAHCLIDSSGITIYNCLLNIEQMASMDTLLVRFDPWTPTLRSVYLVHFTMYLVGDLRPANNARTATVRSVFDHDVGILSVHAPCNGAIPSYPVNPEIEIENAGLYAAGPFDAVCEITNEDHTVVYHNTYMTPTMAAGSKRLITFAPWTPSTLGPFTFRFEINNSPDQFPANNKAFLTAVLTTEIAEKDHAQPDRCLMASNYPNPFNSATTINVRVPAAGRLTLRLFNSAGRPVWAWHSQRVEKGEQRIFWNGENQHSEPAASGVYVYRFEFENEKGMEQSFTGKMLMVR